MREDVQWALEDIPGLTLGECLLFFYNKATERDRTIASLCVPKDLVFEIDGAIVSEGEDNGAYVLGWRWVPFEGTALDKGASTKGYRK